MHKLLIISYLLCFSATVLALPGEPSKLEEADQLCRQALALAQEDSAAAQENWRRAATLYESLIADGNYSNGKIYYNLGNTYAQLENWPQAIASYRRAQTFLPHNRQLQANLQYARAQRQDHFPAPEENSVLQTLFFWHYDFSFHTRLWTAVLLSVAFWAAALLLLWFRPAWLKAVAALLLLGTLTFGTSSLISIYNLRRAHPAVIVAKGQEGINARKGDGNSYAAAFDAPLHAGTEVSILRTRGDWCEIALPNHETGWLEADNLLPL